MLMPTHAFGATCVILSSGYTDEFDDPGNP